MLKFCIKILGASLFLIVSMYIGCKQNDENKCNIVNVPVLAFNDVLLAVDTVQLESGDHLLMGEPSACHIFPNGNIVIADANLSKKVFLFSSSGRFLRIIGSHGYLDGQYMSPDVLQVDHSGKIYIIDNSLNRLTIYSLDGKIVAVRPLDGKYCNAVIDSAGRIYLDQYHAFGNSLTVLTDNQANAIKLADVVKNYAPMCEGGVCINKQQQVVWINPMTHKFSVLEKERLKQEFHIASQEYIPPPEYMGKSAPPEQWYRQYSHVTELKYLMPDTYLCSLVGPWPSNTAEGSLPPYILELFDRNFQIKTVIHLPRNLYTTSGDHLYSVSSPNINSAGNIVNPKIISYKLKKWK